VKLDIQDIIVHVALGLLRRSGLKQNKEEAPSLEDEIANEIFRCLILIEAEKKFRSHAEATLNKHEDSLQERPISKQNSVEALMPEQDTGQSC